MKQTLSLVAMALISLSSMAQGDYPLNFDPETLMVKNGDRAISAITFTSPTYSATVDGWKTTTPFPVYTDATAQKMTFKPGEEITPTVNAKSTGWMYAYIYIDYNKNGQFDIEEGELVTQTTNGSNYNPIPSFTLPADLEDGEYRVRFKTDWDCQDPGGRYGEKYDKNFINDNRGQIIDFTLRIDKNMKTYKVVERTEHCNLYQADGVTQLPTVVNGNLTFKVVPMEDYVLNGTLQVKVGSKTYKFEANDIPEDGIITISDITGSVSITAAYKQGPKATWQCIFNDEFNSLRVGWNEEYWTTTPKSGATWARFNSQDPNDGVVNEQGGYVSFTTKTTGNGQMLTGNIRAKSPGPGTFTYGRVEARCKVYPHTGNFPAFWMMPAAQKPNYNGNGTWGGWPHSGEIDIMEQINNDNVAHHTIHSHYANGAGEGGLGQTYQKTANETVDMQGKWHIYALEWDEQQLRWYVDGKRVHKYDRIAAKDNDNDRQWPFDRPFYIILNQSVGNGGWAAAPDFSFTYRMDVDYVRVYQRCEPTAISDVVAKEAVDVRASDGRIIISAPVATNVTIANLGGAIVYNDTVSGTKSISVPAGIYIAAGKKVVVK